MVTFKNIKKSISPSNHHEKFTIETAKPKKKTEVALEVNFLKS